MGWILYIVLSKLSVINYIKDVTSKHISSVRTHQEMSKLVKFVKLKLPSDNQNTDENWFNYFRGWKRHNTKCFAHFLVKYLTDLQLAQQESLRLESSAPEENVIVDKKAVDKLTEGLLSHYLPDLQNSKRALQELTWVFPCFRQTNLYTPDGHQQATEILYNIFEQSVLMHTDTSNNLNWFL